MALADQAHSQPQPGLDVSVAIRAYNSTETIGKILDKLKSQTGTEGINWEIIVVDNNSTDDTQKIVQDYQASWDRPYALKYFLESRQGAAFARRRAIAEATGEIISFLDDDNFPDSHWVAEIYAFGKAHPKAGVFGSRIRGEFEVTPPKNFRSIQGFLAIKEYGETPRLFNADKLDLPAGAGMAVRRQVWLDSIPDQMRLKGPVGKSLASKGEDFESMVHISRAGWEIWYSPKMCIYHQIPACRLEKDYLLKLVRSSGLNVCTLRLTKAKPWQKPVIVTRIVLGNSRRAVKHFFKHRGRFEDDVVASCEMAFFVSSLISPLNHLKNTRSAK
ncbi:hormogonium polysaccharide biosynthesis glycosyltransferase HpsE [Leptolyngbya sp. BC1307]|uniref:hormogonium polysaccharide biosynthesis glycosyltransferase HpsE n=1 Tax=Leptolyngbya sp. BC1307 TaxID=2029589 RepID=UPI000EFC7110|nr:hormogonium polysaccharide biosynthesis glycosyltransferase HpsE [Leptolyngbya sp. BC1307]